MFNASRALWLAWPLGTLPFVALLWRGLAGALGPDPAKTFVATLGWWTLVALLATLAVRPLLRLTHTPWLFPLRRTLGLLTFAYASVHLLAWAGLFLGWDWSLMGTELNERPYILVGFSAWLLLLPLAVTSTRTSQRRLGRRWALLHRLIFPALLLGLIHDIWIQKSGYGEQLVFAVLSGGLLGWRVLTWRRAQRAKTAAACRGRPA